MSEAMREALQTLRDNIRDEKGSVQRRGVHDNNDTRDAIAVLLENKSALSANGGDVVAWYCVDPQGAEPQCAITEHQKEVYARTGREILPLYLHPAPPSVAVPEGFCLERGHRLHYARTGEVCSCPKYIRHPHCDRAEMDETLPIANPWLTAAPSPDHSGDANKVVDDLPGMWDQSGLSGGETDADHIADAGKVSFVDGLGAQRMTAEECKEGIEYIIHGDNIYWPLSDDDELRLIQAACGNGEFTYPQATPSVPENDNGVSSAYDSGYLDAMLYARVCCDRLDNPENTKDYRDCARFLDLIFKSEIDEAARLRQSADHGRQIKPHRTGKSSGPVDLGNGVHEIATGDPIARLRQSDSGSMAKCPICKKIPKVSAHEPCDDWPGNAFANWVGVVKCCLVEYRTENKRYPTKEDAETAAIKGWDQHIRQSDSGDDSEGVE